MEELKLQAQKALQTGRGMLLSASGDILHGALGVWVGSACDPCSPGCCFSGAGFLKVVFVPTNSTGALTVGQAGLKTGDVLTLHIREMGMAATATAFAAILGDAWAFLFKTTCKRALANNSFCLYRHHVFVHAYLYMYRHTN